MTLPEADLGALTAQQHEDHHLVIHPMLNELLVDADLVGDVLGKVSSGTGLATVGTFQPHFTHANQIEDVTHSSSGVLTLAAQRDTRVFRVTASANITGLASTGMEFIGDGFSMVWVRIRAIAAITIDLSGSVEAIGSPPASLESGETYAFPMQRWDT